MTWVILGHTFLQTFQLTNFTARNVAPAFMLLRYRNRLNSRTSTKSLLSAAHKDLRLRLCSMLSHLSTHSFSWEECWLHTSSSGSWRRQAQTSQGENIKIPALKMCSDSKCLQTRDNLNPVLCPPLHPADHSLRSHPGSCHSRPSTHGLWTLLVVCHWYFRGWQSSLTRWWQKQCLLYWNINNHVQGCRAKGWENLLYMNTLLDDDNGCMGVTW